MDQDERLRQLLLAVEFLGPVFPLWGIMEKEGALCCECGKADCINKGKHPRLASWKECATSDATKVKKWFRKWPTGNFGVATGRQSIAIDLDVRPTKNGLGALEQFEFDCGKRLPFTITVETGRGNRSQHRYFKLPGTASSNRTSAWPGIDVRSVGGYCVGPGSRHISGGYYRFAEELEGGEIALASLPPVFSPLLLLRHQQQNSQGDALRVVAGREDDGVTVGPDALPALPDYKVIGMLMRDSVARRYWEGEHNPKQTLSEDDFALACKLSFYCRRDFKQMLRLFLKSGLYRDKYWEPRGEGTYATMTLYKAISATPAVWMPKKRDRKSTAKGAKKGRCLAPVTLQILAAHQSKPSRSMSDLASEFGIPASNVRDTIRYHAKVNSTSAENAGPLLHKHPFLSLTPLEPGYTLIHEENQKTKLVLVEEPLWNEAHARRGNERL